MIGNLWEWVADWMQGANVPSTPWNPSGVNNDNYFLDYAAGINPAADQGNGQNLPAAIYRGANGRDGTSSGAFAISASVSPAVGRDDIGFRCAR